MKKGGTEEVLKAQHIMQQIFSKIQASPTLRDEYQRRLAEKSSKEESVQAQLVNMAMQLDEYIKHRL